VSCSYFCLRSAAEPALGRLLATHLVELALVLDVPMMQILQLLRTVPHRILVEDQSYGGFPDWFTALGQRGLLGPLPLGLVSFLVLFVLLAVTLERGGFGRKTYVIGTNRAVADFAGLDTARHKLLIFVASPVLALLKEREPRYAQIRQRLGARTSPGLSPPPGLAAERRTRNVRVRSVRVG